jgi:hypothetical protein
MMPSLPEKQTLQPYFQPFTQARQFLPFTQLANIAFFFSKTFVRAGWSPRTAKMPENVLPLPNKKCLDVLKFNFI